MRTRFVITLISKQSGLRVLAFGNQGRYHHDSRQAAEDWLAAMREDPRSMQNVLGDQPDTLEVREVECYDHGDAIRTCWEK
jgi:hypothetical protein